MIRTQILLTEEQAFALRELAAEEGKSMAELIRMSVDTMLRSRPFLDTEERKRRALSVIGQYTSGVDDLAREHDRYLEESYAN
ncbi:CopG domain protein DNA-binding domain protein [Candidatus Promineifilum breve]|uniref:CopG domain protein DNA-binding domain protein n=1 Tax=Candidatus Promineifilum breve TaxID=1806508 RepID=A0A160T4L1_9CHLR|nr:ribbon-helix-helix protein, CopG family [Candidatus Promineifilum breve]CUS03550.2 CopG domain protein DNA-binding domain protein [Candidatus Promineifilum breve]